jgi:MFS family permease
MLSKIVSSLQHKDFRAFWIANLSANAAAWALILGRALLVYEMSSSSENQNLYVGLVTFLAMIPRVIMPPISGYLADRFERRKVVGGMFALNFIHNVIFVFLVFTDMITMWQVMVLSFINGSARAAQMPVSQALIPNLIPKDKLLNGVALHQATIHGSRLIGPLAILPLLYFLDLEWAFLLCSGFYLISLYQILQVKSTATGNIDSSKNFIQNFLEGIPYVYKHPQLLVITLMAFFHCGFTMSFESMLTVISDDRFSALGNSGVTIIMMATGAGALISALSLSVVTKEKTKGNMLLNLALISGLSPIFLALASNIYLATIAALIIGLSQSGFMTLTHTMIQSVTEDGVRGRVGAVYSVHIGGIMAIMNLINGKMSDFSVPSIDIFGQTISLLSADYMLIAGGMVFILIVLISWFLKTFRNIYQYGMPLTDKVTT